MVLSRDINRTIKMMRGYVDKMQGWGMMSGFVYCDREGAMHVYGCQAIADVLLNHMEEMYAAVEMHTSTLASASSTTSGGIASHINRTSGPEFAQSTRRVTSDIMDTQDFPYATQSKLVLPKLTAAMLSQRNFHQNRYLALQCVKSSLGSNRRRIGWGVPEVKPLWWPEDIPWTKRGVQCGINHRDLKRIIAACYKYHQQPLEDDDDDEYDAGMALVPAEPDYLPRENHDFLMPDHTYYPPVNGEIDIPAESLALENIKTEKLGCDYCGLFKVKMEPTEDSSEDDVSMLQTEIKSEDGMSDEDVAVKTEPCFEKHSLSNGSNDNM